MVTRIEPEDADPAARIEELLTGDNVEAAAELLADMHPADQADLYDRLDDAERETMLALLSTEARAEATRRRGLLPVRPRRAKPPRRDRKSASTHRRRPRHQDGRRDDAGCGLRAARH